MKEEKTAYIAEITERINASPFVIIVDYAGLDVPGFMEIRNRLSETNAEFHVVKNSFIKRAASEAGLPDELAESLGGQTALVTGESDVCAAAKAVKSYSDEFKLPALKVGVLDGKFLEADELNALASLPSREILLGQLLGVLNAPATKLARVLTEPAGSLARILQAKADQGE